MTAITIYRSGREYKRLTCNGHAGFAAYGRDIVCASVSCLVINTVNSLDELVHEKMELDVRQKQGYIDCRFPDGLSSVGRLLMDSLVLGLRNIEESYGRKYLELKLKEV